MIGVFTLGYLGIIFEEKVALNKSGVALLMAVALWTIRATSVPHDLADHELESKVAEVSSIVFFLIGAMTIVEIVDAHKVQQSQIYFCSRVPTSAEWHLHVSSVCSCLLFPLSLSLLVAFFPCAGFQRGF